MLKRFTLPAPARLVVVLLVAALLATLADPYLGLASPLAAQAVNAVLPVLLVLLLWGITGRAWLALVVELLLLGVLRYVDQTKVRYLDTDLVYADFTIIGGLLKDPQLVLGFVHPTAKKVAAALVAVPTIVAAWWFLRRKPKATWRFRTTCVALAVLAGGLAWRYHAPDIIDALGWEVYAQATGARVVGVSGNVMLGRMTARDVQRKPDPRAVQAFWNEPLVAAARQQVAAAGDGQRPDIVIIQSESLFEPSQLCGFADAPVLQRISAVDSGKWLQVPVFGGRTLQTEFEVLTGTPIAFYPGSMFAYYELVNHPIAALPRTLGGLGYQTTFIHPNDRGFWRRGVAMADMGFGTFQDIGSFVSPRDFSRRGHVGDAVLTRTVLAALDSASGPAFVTAVTMENHGPWGEFAPKDTAALGLPAQLTGEARTQMADYLQGAKDADQAYGFLLDALKRRGRPTVVLIYGDHLPALAPVYQQLCFKDGQPPEAHWPPYRIWANFPVPKAPDVNSAYLLPGWLLRVAGLPLQGHLLANALAGAVAADPAASEVDRQRVLDEYAHVAAADLERNAAPAQAVKTVFVDRTAALPLLLRRAVPGSGSAVSRDGDLYLPSAPDAKGTITFATDAAVAALTLRPYVGAPLPQCLGVAQAPAAAITVAGDGRVLYRAALAPGATRLAPLDLRGVRRLTIRTEQAPTHDVCAQVRIRVAQMSCYAARCNVPGPARLAAASAAEPSRILSSDPVGGDMAAAAALVPEERKRLLARMANLRWLVAHETASQQGLAPFDIQPDGRLFMHPAEERSAWVDVDVTGVTALDLVPRINTLSAECEAMDGPGKETGLVGLTVSIDGRPVRPRFLVDRSYAGHVPVTVDGGHTLRIEVDKGNRVAACDWFSVGVDRLEGPAVPTGATAFTPLPALPPAGTGASAP